MQTSKLPIEQQISWLSSHAAGVLKAHEMRPEQSDFWDLILNVTNEVVSLRKKVESLQQQINDSGNFRIGCEAD